MIVTLDTEVNKAPDWRISNPVSFSSVTQGIPAIFSPLFWKHGIRPTYLLSYEVMEDLDSCRVLASLGDSAELGTHLHVDFTPPDRTLFPERMKGKRGNGIQAQLSVELEEAKLASLTNLFFQRFGYYPVSFRSGRYGISSSTYSLLAKLGYKVDSSITPGLLWKYDEGHVDFRNAKVGPDWISTADGSILELPISVLPGGAIARFARDLPELPGIMIKRLFGQRSNYLWLRPSWESGDRLIQYVNRSQERFLVLMLHSMEVIPGASPYCQNISDSKRIVSSMDSLFSFARKAGIKFCTLAEAYEQCKEDKSI